MNPDEFPQPSGRLLRAGPADSRYWAFVPATLPPVVEWSSPLIQQLSRADRAVGELAGLGRTLPNPHLLIQPFVRREAVLSSRIEGTQTDITDLYAYEAGQLPLPGMKTSAPEADVREVLNYVRALEYGLTRLKDLPVSVRLIREVHERLMHGVRGGHATPGEFRTRQNWIGSPGCTLNQASFIPPPVEQMQEGLAGLELYLHSDDSMPPLARLALIHYQFEAIHPFIDGNGRMGRLLLILLLVHWNLLPVPLLYLSAFFERNRDQYYDLLMAVSQRSAWHDWLIFFLHGVQEQSLAAVRSAKELQDLQREWQSRLQKADAAGRLFRLVESLLENPVLTVSAAEKRLGVSNRTARQYVQKMIDLGIVNEYGQKEYGRVYYSPAIFDILEQDITRD